MPKWRVHWSEERHYTADVECDEVTVERAEDWLRSGHPDPRDRMEIAEAMEFMQGLDCVFEAKLLGQTATVEFVDETVRTLTRLED